MLLSPENARVYSRNKNIVFEEKNEKRIINKLVAKIITKFRNLTALSSRAVFPERIIEYPLLFQYLDKKWKSILDFGCVEDLLPIHLASIGYKVTGLDFRQYPFIHPNFEFIKADILTWEPPKEKYDCVMSISTVEHVGLGGYRDPVCNNGDKIAVRKLFTSLKLKGSFIVTVPFGKFTIKRNMRIYNYEKLHELIPNIEVERFFFKPSRHESWRETSWEEINNLEYEDYYRISPVQGVAFVVAGK